jgi:hypothetical protein
MGEINMLEKKNKTVCIMEQTNKALEQEMSFCLKYSLLYIPVRFEVQLVVYSCAL